jgi:hypothetical protein
MRARYVFRDGQFVERKTGEPMTAPDRIASPMLMADVAYKSPLSGKEVTSRSQRREEMKIHGVREVDPSEKRVHAYRSRKWAERMRGDHDPNAGKPVIANEAPFQRLSRDQLPAHVARTIAKV